MQTKNDISNVFDRSRNFLNQKLIRKAPPNLAKLYEGITINMSTIRNLLVGKLSWRSLLVLCLALNSACVPLKSTGNGDPYTGIRDPNSSDPDDPTGGSGKTYEAKLYSNQYKVLVSYQDQGVHDVSLLEKMPSSESYRLLQSGKTTKKTVDGKRVYEASNFSVKIENDKASVSLTANENAINQETLHATKFDCVGKELNAPFAGGLGTKGNPYKICTAAQLNNVRDQYLDSYFVLWADIDLVNYVSGKGWKPIGTKTQPFSGDFDGNLFAIRNLKISDLYTWEPSGLFGLVTGGGVLSNVRIYDADVRGSEATGILVGRIAYAKVINVHTTGNVYGLQKNVGGVIGMVSDETGNPCEYSISRSSSSANASTRNNRVGGLIGSVDNLTCSGLISDSFAEGDVFAGSEIKTDSDFAGGLAGGLYYTSIIRSYSTSKVTGNHHVGGLVGYAYGGSIENSYHRGQVKATEYNAGGILGTGFNNAVITNSYAASSVSAKMNAGGIVGLAYYATKILNSFFVGNLDQLEIPGTSYIGGIVGHEQSPAMATIENSFWMRQNGSVGSINCIGSLGPERCNPQGSDEIADVNYFYSSTSAPLNLWDFASVWDIRALDFPMLKKVQ